jgi:hypothetical protein
VASTTYEGFGVGVYMILVGKPKGKRLFGKPEVDRRIILRWIFRTWFEGID